MLFLDHSSPRADQLANTEAWFRENRGFFSPLKSPSASPSSLGVKKQQSAKRRMSDEYQSFKKSKPLEFMSGHSSSSLSQHNKDWPIFEHPEGGFLQQSPYGNIRIFKDGQAEVSKIDKTTTLESFSTAKTPLTQPHPQQQRHQLRSVDMSPSPSAEVEGYMIEGYQQLENTLNKSYTVHTEEILSVNYNLYDHSNEDAHLDEYPAAANEDYEMSF